MLTCRRQMYTQIFVSKLVKCHNTHIHTHIAVVIILCKGCDGDAIREEKYAHKKMLIIRLTKEDIKAKTVKIFRTAAVNSILIFCQTIFRLRFFFLLLILLKKRL